MNLETFIYSLRDETGLVRYVGKTTRSLNTRLSQHIAIAKSGKHNYHRDRWIRKMLESGNVPKIHLIETTQGNGCREEIRWIAFLRKAGFPLTNTTDGGEGVTGLKHSEKTKLHWSITRSGRKTGRPIHPNAKLAFRAANLGRPKSPAHRKAISEKLKGSHLSKSTREKLSQIFKGRKFTPEWIKKIQDSRRRTRELKNRQLNLF